MKLLVDNISGGFTVFATGTQNIPTTAQPFVVAGGNIIVWNVNFAPAPTFPADFLTPNPNATTYTVVKAGYYFLEAQCSFEAAANGARGLGVAKNGVLVPGGLNVIASGGAGDGVTCGISMVLKFAIGDTIQILAFQSSGGPVIPIFNEVWGMMPMSEKPAITSF